MDIVIGKFSGDVELCYAMGKEKFLAAHTHVHNAEAVWNAIEKAAKKNGPKAN